MKNFQFVSFFALVFLLSCKKDAQVDKQFSPKVQITTTDLFFRGELDYDHAIAQIVGEKMRMVVPVKNTDGHKSFRYKISEHIRDGDPARTGYILSLKELTKDTDLFSLPINSKGSSFTNSKENGLTKDQNGKIVAKVKSDKGGVIKSMGEVLNLYAGCGDLGSYCIDWYFVTVDPTTGNVISENYVYTTCYDPCSFSSNPSGGGGSTSENCNDVADQLKSGPVSFHLGIDFVSDDGISERKLNYVWGFHRQKYGMWEFRSIELGTHKKHATNVWKWKSLEHKAVTRHGWTMGGVVGCTVNSAISHVGEYFAGMQLNYTINASAICKGSPISWDGTFTGYSPIWHVDQTPPQS